MDSPSASGRSGTTPAAQLITSRQLDLAERRNQNDPPFPPRSTHADRRGTQLSLCLSASRKVDGHTPTAHSALQRRNGSLGSLVTDGLGTDRPVVLFDKPASPARPDSRTDCTPHVLARERVTELARHQREDPLAFLAQPDLFGDLIEHSRFVEAYRSAVISLHDHGARATLQ